jgi:hypothetical protein
VSDVWTVLTIYSTAEQLKAEIDDDDGDRTTVLEALAELLEECDAGLDYLDAGEDAATWRSLLTRRPVRTAARDGDCGWFGLVVSFLADNKIAYRLSESCIYDDDDGDEWVYCPDLGDEPVWRRVGGVIVSDLLDGLQRFGGEPFTLDQVDEVIAELEFRRYDDEFRRIGALADKEEVTG